MDKTIVELGSIAGMGAEKSSFSVSRLEVLVAWVAGFPIVFFSPGSGMVGAT